jgi:hypothetical protein
MNKVITTLAIILAAALFCITDSIIFRQRHDIGRTYQEECKRLSSHSCDFL